MKKIVLLFIVFSGFIAQAQTDLTLHEIYPLEYARTGDIQKIYARVGNTGTNTISVSDITMYWQVQGGTIQSSAVTGTYPVVIVNNQNVEIGGATVAYQVPSFSGQYEVKVWVKTIGDNFAFNDTLKRTVKVIDNLPTKNVLLEVYKHQTCGPCYPADTMVKGNVDPLSNYNNINIYTGSGDVLFCAEGKTMQDVLGTGTHPTATFDHFNFPVEGMVHGFYTLNGIKYLDHLNRREEYLEPVEVKFNTLVIDKIARTITTEINAKFFDDISKDLRFNLYVLEDSVLEYQASAPNPNNYYHSKVMRTALGGAWGVANSIPNPALTGQNYTYTFNYTVPANYDMEKLRLIALVGENGSGQYQRKTYNSAKVILKDYWNTPLTTSGYVKSDPMIYPNPAEDFLNIKLNQHVKIHSCQIVDFAGQVITEETNMTRLDISQLAEGAYLLRIMDSKGQVHTKPFVKR